jgi:type II secretory pathway pseudopilin PulG
MSLRIQSRRILGRLRRDERGITLAELIIAIGLLSLFATVLTSLYVSSIRAMSVGRDVHQNTGQASNAMNELSRVIRAGTDNPVRGQALNDPAFYNKATATEIYIYAYINLDSSAELPVMINFQRNSQGVLIERRWPATLDANGYWKFPDPASTVPASTRTVASTLPSTPLFTYLKSDNTVIPIPVGGITDPNTLRSIAAVTVSLTIQSSLTDTSQKVTLQNTVGIPNLGIPRSLGGA